MNKGKKWERLNSSQFYPKGTSFSEAASISNFQRDELINILLENRGLTKKEDIDRFLHPELSEVTSRSVGLDEKQLQKALKRLQEAKEKKEKIVVFGDYDVDGITGTAILWETLYALGFDVTPYIPHRVDEGYGLSLKGIENCIAQITNCSLIMTVDNGIVANEAVGFAKEKGIDVIITDHHTPPAGGGETLPKAHAIVHTTQLCGAGVAYMLSQEIRSVIARSESRFYRDETTKQSSGENKIATHTSFARSDDKSDHLALVALATVADLVPLQGANRTLLIEGLNVLKKTSRPGILALCKEAQILPESIDVYTIGHVIGPRLNAMGRMESAMDSLRLLCTKDRVKAMVYADTLGSTNKERQLLTQSLSEHAKSFVRDGQSIKNILIIANDAYEEGVIGLIAGKLVEEFYRPAIVIAKGEKVSKASARSVSGFNIIEFIRSASHLLINAGGHPMAAGFTIETDKIQMLQEFLEETAAKEIGDGLLQRVLKIDCDLPLDLVSMGTYEAIQELAPFGMGNSEPVFSSEVIVKDIRTVGQEGKHLKLQVKPSVIARSETTKQSPGENEIAARTLFARNDGLHAIGFGMGEMKSALKIGEKINIAYTISQNIWNGRKELQLKLRDIQFS